MASPRRPDDQPEGAALERLVALARECLPAGGAPEAEAAKQRAYQRLRRARVEERGGRPRRTGLWLGLAAVTAGAFGLVIARRLVRQPEPLSFAVEGGAMAEGGYVSARSDGETGLRFSDGSDVRLAGASRGRVAATSPRGARVILDHGRARVSVRPRPDGDWVFDAG